MNAVLHGRIGGIHLDVIAHGICREDAKHAAAFQPLFFHDRVQHLPRFVVQFLALFPYRAVQEDLRILAGRVGTGELVDAEKLRPVDELHDFLHVVVQPRLASEEARLVHRFPRREIELRPHLPRLLQREVLLVEQRFVVLLPHLLVALVHVLQEEFPVLLRQQPLHHADGEGGVLHVDRALVLGRDLHRGVPLRRGRAADQERLHHLPLRHLLRDVDHLVERGRDQTGEPDHVCVLPLGLLEDAVAGDHNAQVHDLVVVAAENDANDVLADVVHVALHSGEQDGAAILRLLWVAAAGEKSLALLRLHERIEVADSLLHHTGRLDHLRKKHLARTKKLANHVHTVHERPLDYVEWLLEFQPRFLGIFDNVLVDSLHQSVPKSLLYRKPAPLLFVHLFHRGPCFFRRQPRFRFFRQL
mmetsp:Transcript_2251/g.5321  ORF Transcript_2251/g.5321 Transcript_2251/m.5321 type:complete len:416 (+) Transcript_2251:979-2226(+)